MNTKEAAHGRWGMIFKSYGMPPINPKKHYPGECPICGGKDKIRIDDKTGNGDYICVCGAGNGFQLIERSTGKNFATIAKEIDAIIGNDYTLDKRQPTQPMDVAERARDRFLSLPKIKGSDGERYLNGRGIFCLPRSGVRWSPGEFDGDEKREIPCIYAIASNEYGEPVYRHLTYIEGGKKAQIDRHRKMLTLQEFHGSVAVKLFQSTDVLGIAEGIETAISAYKIYSVPAWASLNATLLAKFRAPTGVKTLYIFADNDRNGTGLSAAFACGKGNLLSKNDVTRVVIRWPETDNDFNDVLSSSGRVIQWVIGK